jgi:cell division protein FtsI/penicillin-binding protein 2
VQSKVFNKRLFVIIIFLFFSFAFLFIRCINLQILKFSKFSQLAQSQQSTTVILEPQRGKIFDTNMNILATSLAVESVYAEPYAIENLNDVANTLSRILNLEKSFIMERLNQPKFFVWIKRKVPQEEILALKKLNLKGIGFLKEPKRYYPLGSLASHILGFVGMDNVGLEGVELYYDDYLKGTKGYKKITRDARLRELSALSRLYMPAVDGYNLILTIDSVIQSITENALREGMSKFNAKAASAIVINPYSGEILAMANFPDFDPNFFAQYPQDSRRNRAICDMFEPGSAFKIVTASAALEEGLVNLEDLFYCEEGTYRVSKHVLHDHRPYGWLTFEEVIKYSSNIGTVKVAQGLKEEMLYKYIKLYGFGSATGVDLPGEIGGSVYPPSQWSKVSIAAVPIGHEVGVTSLQMATAISVIANGGYWVRPYVLRRIEDKDGRIIKAKSSSQIRRRVISKKTSQYMKKILSGVVESGTGKRARLKDFSTAGKTGTAQKIEANGRYSHSKYVASFVGFAPVDNPKVAICVVFDEPKPVFYGGSVAAPVFAKIMDATLKYLEVR